MVRRPVPNHHSKIANDEQTGEVKFGNEKENLNWMFNYNLCNDVVTINIYC